MNKSPETTDHHHRPILDEYSVSFGEGPAPKIPDSVTLTGGEVSSDDGRAMRHIIIKNLSPEGGDSFTGDSSPEEGGDPILTATFTTDRHPIPEGTGRLRGLAKAALCYFKKGNTIQIDNITVAEGPELAGEEAEQERRHREERLAQAALLLIQDRLAGEGSYPPNLAIAVLSEDQEATAEGILVPGVIPHWRRANRKTPGLITVKLPAY